MEKQVRQLFPRAASMPNNAKTLVSRAAALLLIIAILCAASTKMKKVKTYNSQPGSDINVKQNIGDARPFVFKPDASNDTSPELVSLTNLRDVATTQEINPKQMIVIIVTQGRSGSMFTGATLSTLPGVYYTHEPVRHWFYIESRNKQVTEKDVADLFDAMLQCRIHEHKSYLIYRQVDIEFNDVLREYFIYAKNEFGNYGEAGNYLTNHGYFRTFHCKRSRIHLLKTIWFRMKHLLKYLSDPTKDVRIIHLLRDPRGLLNSPLHSEPAKYAPELCANITDDLAAAEIIRDKYPERYFRVMYEDLAMFPLATFRRMLQFIGVPFTAAFHHTIERQTHVFNGESNGLKFSIAKYSKNRPFRWRQVVKFEDILQIQNHCGDILQELGLRVFQSEDECRNVSLPVWTI